MSALGRTCRLFAHEWRVEWRRGDTLPTMTLFTLSSLIVFEFAFDLSRPEMQPRVPAALWTVWAFASLVPFADAFRRERHDGTYEALRFTALSPSAIGIVKTLGAWVKLSILQAVSIPIAIVWFNMPGDAAWLRAAPAFALHALGLCILGTLGGAVAARLDRGEALAAVLTFPLAAPVLLSAVRTTGRLLDGESWPWTPLGAILLVDLLFLSLGALLWETVLDDAA